MLGAIVNIVFGLTVFWILASIYNNNIFPSKEFSYINKIKTKLDIIPITLIFIAIIGVILFFFKKYKDKVAIVNPNILKSGVSDLDIDAIIKDANKKKEADALYKKAKKYGSLCADWSVGYDFTCLSV